MSRRRRIFLVLGVVVGLTLVTTGVASADDCSSPADCSNTAWTVGGASAAAAAIVGAAAAGGWLPNGPTSREGGFTEPDCYSDLHMLAEPIRGTVQQIAELETTLVGADRMWLDAQQRATNLQWEAVNVADSWGLDPVGAAGLGISASGPLATKLEQAAANHAATMQQYGGKLQNAAADFRRIAGQTALEQGSDAAATFSQEARRSSRLAGEYLDEAAQTSERAGGLGRLGRGLSVVNILTTVYGQTIGAGRRSDALQNIGALTAQADFARMEAARWNSYRAELTHRIDALVGVLRGQIAAYNARAQECNAVPLSDDMERFTRTTISTAAQQLDAWQASEAPASVLARAPEPLKEEDRPRVNCDGAAYAAELQAYKSDIERFEQTASDFKLRRQQATDIELTRIQIQNNLTQIQYQLANETFWYRIVGMTSGSATAVTLLSFLSPPVAMICGGISFVAGIAESQLSPSSAVTVLSGALQARIDWLRDRNGYNSREQVRLSNILDRLGSNMWQRRNSLWSSFRECGGDQLGWERAPDVPSMADAWAAPTGGQWRTLEEIGTWR